MTAPRNVRKIGEWTRRPKMSEWHIGAMWRWDLDRDNSLHIVLDHNVFQLRGFINGRHVAKAARTLKEILAFVECYLSIVEIQEESYTSHA